MSKADSRPTTLASGLNRRGVLTGAGGIAAAGVLAALPTATAAAGFSPEFLEYRRRHSAWMACYAKPYVEDAAWEALRAVNSRPATTWQDVTERAWVVRTQLFQLVDGEYDQHSDNDELTCALMDAIFAIVEGGAHV